MAKCHGLEISYAGDSVQSLLFFFVFVWDNLKVELKKAYDRRYIIIA